MSLFRRETDFTSLFFTREDNRTNLFFTEDSSRQYELDATIQINGFTVTASNLNYSYSETSRVNDTGTVLYFAQGDFTGNELGLITNGTRYPTTLPSGTIPFTNPNPANNPPSSTTTLNEHPELFGQVFSAMLVNETTLKYGTLVTSSDNFSVGATVTGSRLYYRNTNSTNKAFFDLYVDTTYNSYWFNIATGTINFEFPANVLATDFDFPYHTYVYTLSTGGHTAPFDRQSRWVLTDSSPYEYGEIDVFSFAIQVSNTAIVSEVIGNGLITAVNSGSFSFLNNAPIIIDNPNADIDWKGIASASLFDDRIEIVPAGSWSFNWYYRINGGTIVTVGDSTVTTASVSLSNNDDVEIFQPINGSKIELTYVKSITVSYTPSPPPTSYSVVVTTVGIHLPHNVQIKDNNNNNLVTFSQDTNPKTIDLRDVNGTLIYGEGIVTFHAENVNVSFDASHYNDGSFTYSGVEIENYAPTLLDTTYPTYRVGFGGNPIFTTASDTLYFGNFDDTPDLFLNGVAGATTHDFTLTDADFVSPAIYSTDTLIPAQNPTILARYLDNTVIPELLSPLYSAVVPITDITTEFFKTKFGTFYQFDSATNQLSCRVSLQTALNGTWKQIGDSYLEFQYDPNLIEFVSPTSPTGFYAWDGINYIDPVGQKTLGISFSNAKAGNFDYIDVVFAVYQSSFITTAITSGAHTSIKDTGGNVILSTNPIDFTNTGYFWNGISSFTYTPSSFTITPTGSWTSLNWSYQINSGTTVSVPGTQFTVSGLTINNGDIIRVNQPINGDPIIETVTGLTFIPPDPLSNYVIGSVGSIQVGDFTTSPDGTYLIQMDLTGASTTTIRVYTMSTPFDVSTMTLTSTSSAASMSSRPRGLVAQNDDNTSDSFHGRRFWVFQNNPSTTVYLYTTPNAYDMTGGTWSTVSAIATVPRQRHGAFTNNGTTLALCDDSTLRTFTLSTAYDLSTLNYTAPIFSALSTSFGFGGGYFTEICWVNQGRYCFITNVFGFGSGVGLYDCSASPYDYNEMISSLNHIDIDTTTFNFSGNEMCVRFVTTGMTTGSKGLTASGSQVRPVTAQ